MENSAMIPEPSGTASVEQKMEFRRALRLERMPESARGHFVASWSGKASPRRAIKAQCLECQGFDRAAVTECTAYACSLWMYRPFQGKEG